MKRLAVVLLALVLLVAPLAADAQPAGRVWRIGTLSTGPGHSPFDAAFVEGLRDLGYVEGQNVVMERRFAQGKLDRLPNLAAELVAAKVDVILVGGTPGIKAAKDATQTIPIVMVALHDPVSVGLVSSLARPGANLTGLSCFAQELSGKWLELVKETVPGATRVALASTTADVPAFPALELAARLLGLQLRLREVRGSDELDNAFAAMSRERTGALLAQGDLLAQRRRIAELAMQHRLPTVFDFKEFVEAGGLMSYGADLPSLFRRAAYYVDRILKGAKPAELPVEQPTKFVLAVNLKTAKALGLTIPQSVLIRADEVIQ